MEVLSSQGPYTVEFPDSLAAYKFSKLDSKSDYYLVADTYVWKLYENLYPEWADFPKFLVEANENTKTLACVEDLSRWLISHHASKTSSIIAFGGGVIQDLVTFTSRNFHRGCSWEYHPTTLLSQSDSCIGSKCGINVLPHKNQLGTVYAPRRVVVISELLDTLTHDELVSGYGEIFKLSITGPGHFYSKLREMLSSSESTSVLPSGDILKELIFLSLNAKKFVIEEDEHERGPRRVLNYGHSFGHALESLTENRITHGHAIVFGMDLINYLGVQWGITEASFYSDFNQLLRRFFGTTPMPSSITASSLVHQLRTDKKMAYGKMNFAVPTSVGDIRIVEKDLNTDLEVLVKKYLSECNVFITS
jgi:3-dehydroquinate synthase